MIPSSNPASLLHILCIISVTTSGILFGSYIVTINTVTYVRNMSTIIFWTRWFQIDHLSFLYEAQGSNIIFGASVPAGASLSCVCLLDISSVLTDETNGL
uniref:Uncharacterized protein n=1 Tax=Cacopsylla melanoneura TaxID=428564 RepID=A0A8D8LI99_9HEMI